MEDMHLEDMYEAWCHMRLLSRRGLGAEIFIAEIKNGTDDRTKALSYVALRDGGLSEEEINDLVEKNVKEYE